MRHPEFRCSRRPSNRSVLELQLVRWVRLRHGFGGIRRGWTHALHDHVLDKHGCERFIAGVALDSRDGFYDVHIAALSPDRITAIQRSLRRLGNEELAA